MERTTHRTLKTSVAEEEDNNGSAPTTGRHCISRPPSLAAVKKESMKKNPRSQIGHSRWSDRDWLGRNARKNSAEAFQKEYTYGSVVDGCISKEQKSCIWHGNTFSWQDKSSGTIWVGVHGTDSICVVTRSGDLDVTRLRGTLKRWPIYDCFFKFRKSLIAEIEDLAGRSGKLRRKFRQKIKKPFGVVSVTPDTRNADPCVENGEIKAIEFLQEKMSSDTAFTVGKTIQTTISAFQHLFQKKFKPDEIQVCVMDPKYSVCIFQVHKVYKDPTVEELNIDQIKEHLDVVNKSPEDSNSGSETEASGP